MNRRKFLTATVSAAGATGFIDTGAAATPDDTWPSRDHVAAQYRKVMEFFRTALPEKLGSMPVEIGGDSWIRRVKATDSQNEDYVAVSNPSGGPFRGIVRVRRSDGELLLAGASVNAGPGNVARRVPTWSISDAIDKAAGWLKRFGWEMPSHFQIGKISYSSEWSVHWHRVYGTIPELQRSGEAADEYSVALEEGDSGVRLVRQVWGPEPTSLTPKLTRTEAVIKASAALATVMATGIYKAWMPAGMSPMGLEKAELLVLRPNWLLDPKRYSLDGPKGPVERRLCWEVTFQLSRVDKIGEKNGKSVFKTIAMGLVYVHVDAVSGEVVGGNMLPGSG